MARILLVNTGILYGAAAVRRVDVVVVVIALLSALPWALDHVRKGLHRAASPAGMQTNRPDDAGPVELAGALATAGSAVAAVVIGVATALITIMNFFSPVEPVGITRPACAGARTNHVAYVGLTMGLVGNNSRQGPATFYAANGRFARDCTVGFSAYCLGEPVGDSLGTTVHQRWVTNRWLLVAKQPPGWRSTLARWLSGERSMPQFVSDAYVTPITPYESLRRAPSSTCSKSYKLPGKAKLQTFDPNAQSFTARADHAVNMGFAVWVPPGQGFVDADSYHQIYKAEFKATQNPGATSADGAKTVDWAYHESLLKNLRSRRPHAPARVVVMAIPCISDNLQADVKTAAIATYDIASGPQPKLLKTNVGGYKPDLLAHAACQANT
ncbi:hypothetical protein [Actinopolymorpha cephalotaxi]|uniref:Uncharacterized protein n=1 Tax=Actinopolymorpha cephalotaxi TaxID=504797 RepID=A0ABX2S0M9_9ACTN|nr:hypothetical protein [Actinopolymorpha cephalotaxi]NYH82864.1 hypothetical protein [Actinopolymorpha cephalotaxi]